MRRYMILLGAVLVVGVLLASTGRRPRALPLRASQASVTPEAALAITIDDAGLRPERCSVPGGASVSLALENHTTRAITVALAGYEDRLPVGTLAPGSRWTGRFVADRPGDDFTWLLDGIPTGRFAVVGSHLVQGHQ